MYDPHTRESRGFGFVTMEKAEAAEAAIAELNGTELMGKPIAIEKACCNISLSQYLMNVKLAAPGSSRARSHPYARSLLWTAQAQ